LLRNIPKWNISNKIKTHAEPGNQVQIQSDRQTIAGDEDANGRVFMHIVACTGCGPHCRPAAGFAPAFGAVPQPPVLSGWLRTLHAWQINRQPNQQTNTGVGNHAVVL
jgi:hypothetical protein